MVDLAPYKRRVTTVMRGKETGSDAVRYEIPDCVPTSEPGDETPTRET